MRLYRPTIRTVLRFYALLGAATFWLNTCQPSEILIVDEVQYNFTVEGFLSRNVLQTIGNAKFRDHKYGTDHARRACLLTAGDLARQRMLRVMLHTHFEIQGQANSSYLEQDPFESDYPVEFAPGEYIRAELAFRPLLDKSFIALENARSRSSCQVVLRLVGQDLPSRIRSQTVLFTPRSVPKK